MTVEPEDGAATCDIDALNALLRGEVAAVETYEIVLLRFKNHAAGATLQRLRDEHSDAAAVLRERVRHFGGDPTEGSGVRGKLATAIAGTANVLGRSAALGALKQGEEFGIGQYEHKLSDPEIDDEDKGLIRFRLLPRCRSHENELSRMIMDLKA